MSSVKIQGSATGTANFTIAVPAGTSTDRTINLPDAAGSFVLADASGDVTFGDNDKVTFGSAVGGDLQIYHDGSNSYIKDNGTGDLYLQGSANVRITDTDGNKMFLGQDGGEVQLYYNGVEKLNTTSAGATITDNLGVGTNATTVASYNTLHVGANAVGSMLRLDGVTSGNYSRVFNNDGALLIQVDQGNVKASSQILFYVDGSEKGRFDQNDNFLVGTTSATGFQDGLSLYKSSQNSQLLIGHGNGAPSGTSYHVFYYNGGTIGTIKQSGTSGVSYNTTSDYRLKENVTDLTGAIDRVKQVPVHRFNFIADPDHTVDGFLAHEVQSIVPEAVTGTQDGMKTEEYEVTPAVLDDDGNVVTEAVIGTREVIDPQGIDQSKLVPLLTQALKDAITKIEALEARVATLEAV